jgi:hypothetical protein
VNLSGISVLRIADIPERPIRGSPFTPDGVRTVRAAAGCQKSGEPGCREDPWFFWQEYYYHPPIKVSFNTKMVIFSYMASLEYINKIRENRFADDLYTCAAPAWRTGTFSVPLTAVLCLILLGIILKAVLLLPAEQFSSAMVLYTVTYLALIVSFPLGETRRVNSSDRTVIWATAIILLTLCIITASAIR